ncbi:hypothetical protein [Allokutzneria oryzae]|uniref:Oxidoreductase n=1 Tax=Allokutzneria oryzae TaxID=1378989 RepID=A0ABV6A0F4_9PSEU
MSEYVKPSDLTEAEREVCRAFGAGERLVLPLPGKTDRQVRAGVLVALLTDLYRVKVTGIPALRLAGARITGELNLESVKVAYLIELAGCVFTNQVDVRMAQLAGLRLPGSRVPGVKGKNLRVESDLVLEAGFICHGCLDLTDGSVQGTLRLAGAVLRSPQGHALLGARLHISGSLQATAMRATGEVRLRGTNVGGSVHLGGAYLSNPEGDALEASGVVVTGNLFCDGDGGRFTAEGRVVLAGARIGGDAVFSGARLRTPQALDHQVLVMPRGMADTTASLVADRIQVDGNVEMDSGFAASGSVRVPNATIGGYLRLSGSCLGRAESVDGLDDQGIKPVQRVPLAFIADGIEVGGDLEARGVGGDAHAAAGERNGPMCAYGQVRLVDAKVRGSASLSGVHLHGPGIDSLFADRLDIGGTLFLRHIRATGSIRLQNASIGSTLDCTGAHLTKPRLRPDGSLKPSLDARVAMVGKDLLCTHGFLASGGVRVRLVEVHKMASFTGSVLGSAESRIALNAYGLSAQQLVVRFAEPPSGRVILTRATAVSVTDGEFLWAASGGVNLEDFRFEAITAQPEVGVRTRLRWLRRVIPDFAPGPYDLFATFYRRSGHEERAVRVLLEKQRRRHWELGLAGKFWGLLQECTVGYGYRPWLAMIWIAVFWLVGGLWFADHRMQRLDDGQNPEWNPWLVSADLLLPIINLGQDNMWAFTGPSQWVSGGLVALGWVLASTVAAGATRVLKRT